MYLLSLGSLESRSRRSSKRLWKATASTAMKALPLRSSSCRRVSLASCVVGTVVRLLSPTSRLCSATRPSKAARWMRRITLPCSVSVCRLRSVPGKEPSSTLSTRLPLRPSVCVRTDDNESVPYT